MSIMNRDKLTLHKIKTDTCIEFMGLVSERIIATERVDIPFEKDDEVIRQLSRNGVIELYIIDNPLNCMEHHYELHVHRKYN